MTKAMKLMSILLGLLLWSGAHAGKVTYIHTDAQGTPVMESDAQGNITARFEYKPYGAPVTSVGAAPDGPGYTGHVNDPETGLVYMQARYYDPMAGRFLSVDPIGPAAANLFNVNRYNYANNNPVMHTDPDGKCPVCIGIILYFTIDYANAPGPKDTPVVMSNEDKLSAIASALPPGRAFNTVKTVVNISKKAETLAENKLKGKAGEALTRAKLGEKVAGEQVTFKTSDGSRAKPDFVTTDGGVVETKTGGASLSSGQMKLKADIDAGRPVTPVGDNAAKAGLQVGQPTVMKSCVVDRVGC